jgi:hypothetical protein
MRSADDRGVITLEVTLGRTGHTPEPIQHRRPLNQTSMRVRTGYRPPPANDSQLNCDHRLEELDRDHDDHLEVSMNLDWRMRRILP